MPPIAGLDVIGCDQHRELARKAAELGCTLVKDTAGHLPIRPETHPRVRLIVVEAMSPLAHARTSISGFVKEELEAAGFAVDLQTPFADRVKGESRADAIREMMKRDRTKAFEARYDAVFLIINHHGFAQQAAERLRWPSPMASEAPWYVHNVPTVAISMQLPNHLIDIPMVKTYINTYAPTRDAFRIALDKIMGNAEFRGAYSENVFCDVWDTRL